MDAEFWWRLDLSSPLVEVRRMAAMQMLLDPPPPSAAAELRGMAAREADPETRDLLSRIVAGCGGATPEPEPASPPPPSDSTDPAAWPGWPDTPAGRLEWLGRLPAGKRRELAPHVPDRLRNERHPLVASALIRLFGRTWPEERLGDLVAHASGGEDAACLAAIETLRQRAPSLLQPLLPGLLVSANPRIRGAAVGALAGIDLDEALAHLEALLLDPDPARRLEGLRCCLHVPFDKVMPLLLKAMAVETDPRRLAAYGTLFEINPALEAPFRLYELSERVPAERAEILRRLLAASCRVIGTVLLDQARFQEYRNRLQTWIDRRAASRLAQDIVARAMDGRGLDPDLAAALERAKARQPLWTALKELATLPMPVQARALFIRALGEEEPAADAPAPAPAAQPEPSGTSPIGLLERLARFGPETADAARSEITILLNDLSNGEPRFIAAALRAASRAAVDGLTGPARRALAHTDPAIVAAAIEYLDRFAPDDLRPLLGRYLASTEPRIKTAALRVLQRSDPLQAVSALEAMLQSRQPAQQKLGVACLIHVEFALVRDALAALLATKPAPDILEAGLCLFQTNADPDGVYLLYTIERRLPPEAARAVERVRREMMQALSADGRLSADLRAAEAELAERAGREATKQAAQPPAYAYRVLKKNIALVEAPAADPFRLSEETRRALGGFLPVVLVLVAAVILWNGLAGRDGGGSEPAGPAPVSLAGGRHQIRQIEGWVRPRSPSSAEFLVEAETGERFWIPVGDYDPVPAQDAKFKGTLALVDKRDDGAWTARRAAAAGLR